MNEEVYNSNQEVEWAESSAYEEVRVTANFAEAFRVKHGALPTLADMAAFDPETMWDVIDEALEKATPEQLEKIELRYSPVE